MLHVDNVRYTNVLNLINTLLTSRVRLGTQRMCYMLDVELLYI